LETEAWFSRGFRPENFKRLRFKNEINKNKIME